MRNVSTREVIASKNTTWKNIPLGCSAYRCSPIIINFFKQSPQLLLITNNAYSAYICSGGKKSTLGCGAYRCIPIIINFFKQSPLLLLIAKNASCQGGGVWEIWTMSKIWKFFFNPSLSDRFILKLE